MRILLIAGGWSSEREVSLNGAKGMESVLKARGHSVTFFDLLDGFDRLSDVAAEHDFALINLHGAPGEDGLVQALLERVGCPYQGSGPAGSFLALNKTAAKQIFRRAGLLTPRWEFLPVRPSEQWEPSLPYPIFAKSNTGGSSIHLSRADNKEQLHAIINEIFSSGSDVLLEEAISGKEVTCGILEGQALPPVLIEPVAGNYFDFNSKYEHGGAREICPAPLSDEETQHIQSLALRAHRALGLSGYSRSDFILSETGQLFILEVNTLPGMTATSLVPQEAAAIGLEFGDFLEKLIELGLRTHTS